MKTTAIKIRSWKNDLQTKKKISPIPKPSAIWASSQPRPKTWIGSTAYRKTRRRTDGPHDAEMRLDGFSTDDRQTSCHPLAYLPPSTLPLEKKKQLCFHHYIIFAPEADRRRTIFSLPKTSCLICALFFAVSNYYFFLSLVSFCGGQNSNETVD